MADDQAFMAQALELGRRGRGYVSPNPLVGCVIVKEGKVIASGYHAKFGGPHAEVVALEAAGEAAQGATLYVTLEPCCHDGPGKKTPPCAPRLVQTGFARVVIAMRDPNPKVSGGGIALIEKAGIVVDVGILEEEAREMNAPYISLIERGRPWVLAKWAMTFDGKLTTPKDESKWISSEESRRRAHIERGRNDAIMVGIGTVLADDPLLTNRSGTGRQPLRVVVDPRLELPTASKLATTTSDSPVLVFTRAEQINSAVAGTLRQQGVEILGMKPNERGRLPWKDMLMVLGARGVSSVMIEGGGSLLTSAFEERAVDEVMVFVAPQMIGGDDATIPVGCTNLPFMTNATNLEGVKHETIGVDAVITGRVKYATQ